MPCEVQDSHCIVPGIAAWIDSVVAVMHGWIRARSIHTQARTQLQDLGGSSALKVELD